MLLVIFFLYCMYEIIRKMGYKGFWFYFILAIFFPFSLLYLVRNEWPILREARRLKERQENSNKEET